MASVAMELDVPFIQRVFLLGDSERVIHHNLQDLQYTTGQHDRRWTCQKVLCIYLLFTFYANE